MTTTEKKIGVTALIYDEFGRILMISRKHDHNDFGLVGGKVDPGETLEQAIIREVKEETNLDVTYCRPYFTRDDGEYEATTFLCNYTGELVAEKGYVTKWGTFDDITSGTFGQYNKQLREFIKKTPKFEEGDYIYNPNTGEPYLIYDVYNQSTDEIYYVVRTMFTKNKYIAVRATAFDLRIDYIDQQSFFDLSNVLMEDKPKAFAFRSHMDTLHYYGEGHAREFLYSYHLQGTVNVLTRFKHLVPSEKWSIVVGGMYNHDVIEDARKTWNDVSKATNKEVADKAYALTEEKGHNRFERSPERYHFGIAEEEFAELMKLSDTIFNVEEGLRTGSTMVDAYRKEFPKVKSRLWKETTLYQEAWDHLEKLLFGVKAAA